ncbi:MAG: DNA repair protein RadA [Gammaproteobacteria bacterium]|nr:DNA repair protein RadA [Gammaproteobacteria bacterium]
MAKPKLVYHCTNCGSQAPKWSGQCVDCGAWNTMEESVTQPVSRSGRPGGFAGSTLAEVHTLADVKPDDVSRLPTGIGEFDRVLGGGLVPGAVVLIGGDPGIGKSTLLLQMAAALDDQCKTLYVSGEESPQQISLHAHRLSLSVGQLRVLAETRVEAILDYVGRERPQVLVVDSIQTMYTEISQSAPGSVAQVRESAAQLVRFAKQTGTVIFLVGHVTKEGQLAGPRVLEHMVDTVLYFEGDAASRFRVVRAFKNRFGAVNELGVFAMTDGGLKEVTNPSAIFLSRHDTEVAGSAIMVTLEGSRPLLVEVQALVDESHLGNPRRVTLGLEHNRLVMLLAVLHRHGGVATYDQDVFVNVVAGVRVTETGADLAVLLAIISSLRDKPLPSGLVVFGEVGLAGEIRPVPNGEARLKEAAKHGFTRAIVPKANLPRKKTEGMEVVGVSRLDEALNQL